MERKVIIGHLFKEQLNAYGDSFNIKVLSTRLQERGIPHEVREFSLDEELELEGCTLLYLGGGGQRETRLVLDFLRGEKEQLRDYLVRGGAMLATGSGYHIMGDRYPGSTEDIPGLGLLDMTNLPGEGKSGTVLLQGTLEKKPLELLGYLEDSIRPQHSYEALGEVDLEGETLAEGLKTRKFIGTSLHGPVLAKNKDLADLLLSWAVEETLGKIRQKPLRDSIESKLKKKGMK